MWFARVPDMQEVVCFRERDGTANVTDLTYMSVSPAVGRLRHARAPLPLCYPVFGAQG